MSQDLDTALALLRQYKKESLVDLLVARELPKSGTWEEVLERVRAAVADGALTLDDVVAVLDRAEESGHQHVFLYTVDAATAAELGTDERLTAKVLGAGLRGMFQRRTRLLQSPTRPTITAIRQSDTEILVKWAERRRWREFVSKKQRGSQEIWVYERREGRAVNVFTVQPHARTAELRISDVGRQRRQDYRQKVREASQLLAWLLRWDALRGLPLGPAIRALIGCDELRRREHRIHTPHHTTVAFTTDDVQSDLVDDPFYEAAEREATARGHDARYLNAYWLPRPGTPLEREIHTYIYADITGNEVRFSAGCSDEEQRYVVGRIRHFAAGRT